MRVGQVTELLAMSSQKTKKYTVKVTCIKNNHNSTSMAVPGRQILYAVGCNEEARHGPAEIDRVIVGKQ